MWKGADPLPYRFWAADGQDSGLAQIGRLPGDLESPTGPLAGHVSSIPNEDQIQVVEALYGKVACNGVYDGRISAVDWLFSNAQ
jgi:hypothetical protein